MAKYYDEITEFTKSKGREVPTSTGTWIDFGEARRKNEAKAAVAAQQPRLLPKLIEFDEATGMPTNQQDVRVATAQQDNIAIVP